MDLAQLIKHPETMNKETLYDLRGILALYPYFQPARLLLLRNLYLMHDSSFDKELRKAAIYIQDRNTLFQLVEAAHYELQKKAKETTPQNKKEENEDKNRTVALIDNFLDSIPEDTSEKKEKDKPAPANATVDRRPGRRSNKSSSKSQPLPTVDYVAYLLELEKEEEKEQTDKTPHMRGQDLIDNFIFKEGGNFDLKEDPEFIPEIEDQNKDTDNEDETGYFTETLARIYIKQGRYSKALEIIKRLNLVYPKKNRYFADQIRFLEKLIINNKHK